MKLVFKNNIGYIMQELELDNDRFYYITYIDGKKIAYDSNLDKAKERLN